MSEESTEGKYIPLIGDVEDYVGRSPWDFYSWGHIDMGIFSFLMLSLIITVPSFYLGLSAQSSIWWWLIFVLTLMIGIIWEILENSVLYYWGLRPGGLDSAKNCLWDIIFVTLGGGIMWITQFIIMGILNQKGTWFYIVGMISFFIILICYLIGFFITNENTKKARAARKST
jgi:hypothetical protein